MGQYELVDVQMVEIIERLTEMASDETTIDPSTKRYIIQGYLVYVKPKTKFLKYIVRFCNAHAEFLNTKPTLAAIDEALFDRMFNAYGFIAIGRAFNLIDWIEVKGDVCITGYTPRPEPFG